MNGRQSKPRGRMSLLRRESGQHLVEFALVLLPLALLLCGICQYGFIYCAAMTVRNASATAARYATLGNGGAYGTTTNAPTVAQIQSVAQDTLAPMITATINNVIVTVDQNATVGGVGGATSVKVQYNLPLIIPWVVPGRSAGDTRAITATTIMR